MFNIILARQPDGCIGFKQGIPWEKDPNYQQEIKIDRQHFKKLTKGHIVIMGRKTFDSLPIKPLPDRINIVLSTKEFDKKEDTKEFDTKEHTNPPNLYYVKNFTKMLSLVSSLRNKSPNMKAYIIGGATLYKQALDIGIVEEVHETVINTNYFGDTYYKNLDKNYEIVSNSLSYSSYKMQIFSYILKCKNKEELSFLELVKNIVETGKFRIDRTNVGSYYCIGRQLRFSLKDNNFPLITSKFQSLEKIYKEFMWILSGSTNTKILASQGVNVWNYNSSKEFIEDAGFSYEEGDIGPSYGHQMRHYNAKYIDCKTEYKGVDQLSRVTKWIKDLKNIDKVEDETERKRILEKKRRLIIDLYNAEQVDEMVLPPCMYNYQFIYEEGELSCFVTQRSSDVAVAGGWNIAQASLFLILMAKTCGLVPNELVWNAADIHIYSNNMEMAKELTERRPYNFPKLFVTCTKESVSDYNMEDIQLLDYYFHSSLKSILN